MELKFPDGFLWGSSSASYQVEGGIENNDWAEAGRSGRIPVAGRACDHYNLYEEDFDIAKSLGQNAHRLSIEWARVEPEQGKFDDGAIEHYRKVLESLHSRGLEPFVTLWHFTLPLWFKNLGGFENPDSPDIFAKYCEHVVNKLGDRAKFWITINEPMVYAAQGYMRGIWPPFKKNIFKFVKVVDNLATSHNIVYRKIKSQKPFLQLGLASNLKSYEFNQNPFNHLLSMISIFFHNNWFLSKVEGGQDFIGVNYYFHRGYGESARHEISDMGWEIYPKGLYNVLMGLKNLNMPVYITENGIADKNDLKRSKYIRDHIYWMHRAISDGINVRGYLHWSLLDNFEWAEGFDKRFGLVEVDYGTMERKTRGSALEYKKICENNSFISDEL